MKTILLVEDSKFQKLENERLLERAGYNVLCATDGEQALQISQQQIPDLVMLDLLLPKISGVEVLRRFKQNSKTALVPIIVVSSLPKSNFTKLQLEGVEAYFEKAALFDSRDGEDQLLEVIRKVLREHDRKVRAMSAGSTHS